MHSSLFSAFLSLWANSSIHPEEVEEMFCFVFKSYWTNLILYYYLSVGVFRLEKQMPLLNCILHIPFCCHCFSNDFLCPRFRNMSLFRTTQKSKWILHNFCTCSKLNVNLYVTQNRLPALHFLQSGFLKPLSKVVGVFLV